MGIGLAAPVAGVALIAAGCGSSNSQQAATPTVATTAASPQGSATMSADTGAQLAVRTPAPDALVRGNAVPFDLAISGFRVDCRLAGTPNHAGVGHYHVELDGSLINMFCAQRGRVSLQNVAAGPHTLTFLAAENDHTEDTKAETKVAFTYRPTRPLPTISGEQQGTPSIRILSPRPGSTVHGGFDLVVEPRNFEFSCALYGKPNVAGYGHWHANVDSTAKGMMGMGTMLGMSCRRSFHVSLAGIAPGRHTFFAILEDNLHAPTPNAQAAVRLNVQ